MNSTVTMPGTARRPLAVTAIGTSLAAVLALVLWMATTGGAHAGRADIGGMSWPAEGGAALAIGDGPIAQSSGEALPMASISKLVTALMVLEERPLQQGEQGGDYWFTQEWELAYQDYITRGESALRVPVGGMLTQHQLLQGMLIGSACNYTDILVTSVWGDDAAFAAAASDYLERNGLDDITMVEPTGIDARNTATPAALIELGRLALENPVIAEIVATPAVELPGAGIVESTNDLLGDQGVVGVKTGTLHGSNLLSAKDVEGPDGEPVRIFAVVLGQPGDDGRFTASRQLYAQAEERLAAG